MTMMGFAYINQDGSRNEIAELRMYIRIIEEQMQDVYQAIHKIEEIILILDKRTYKKDVAG